MTAGEINEFVASDTVRQKPELKKSLDKDTKMADDGMVRIQIKYANNEGREAVLKHAIEIHNDFGVLNKTMCVSLPRNVVDSLQKDPNIEYAGGDGNVAFLGQAEKKKKKR